MLYLFHGQEDFNIELELQKLKSKVVDKAFLATNYRIYDNPPFQEFIDILRTPSLMFGSVLCVINCEKYFFDTKGKINFDDKELKQIEMLEKRHFSKTFDNLLDEERLNNLEKELMGRTWNYTPQKIRLERIGIASSNFMLIGAALPASISSKRNAKRMRNNSIQLKEKDNVGLIDGFLRLIISIPILSSTL